MNRKTFLGAAVATPLALTPKNDQEHEALDSMLNDAKWPARDSVSFLLNVGSRATEYSFYIDEHTTNLMGMFRAICIAAEGEFVSRVVLPRGVTPHV